MSLEHHAIVARASPRSDLLVFDIRAKITQDEFEWMSGEIESAFDAVNVIALLIVMTNFDGAELSALMDAEALRASTRSLALGDASYSIYLTHAFTLPAFAFVINRSGVPAPPELKIALAFLCSLWGGWFFYIVVERQLTLLLRRSKAAVTCAAGPQIVKS